MKLSHTASLQTMHGNASHARQHGGGNDGGVVKRVHTTQSPYHASTPQSPQSPQSHNTTNIKTPNDTNDRDEDDVHESFAPNPVPPSHVATDPAIPKLTSMSSMYDQYIRRGRRSSVYQYIKRGRRSSMAGDPDGVENVQKQDKYIDRFVRGFGAGGGRTLENMLHESRGMYERKADLLGNIGAIASNEIPKFMILPDASWKLMWDTFGLFLILFYLFVVPMRLAFSDTVPTSDQKNYDFLNGRGFWAGKSFIPLTHTHTHIYIYIFPYIIIF